NYVPYVWQSNEVPPIAAVQEDGEVLYLTHTQQGSGEQRRENYTLWKVSPSEPTPHAIATPPINPLGLATHLAGHEMFLVDGRLAVAEIEPARAEGLTVVVMNTSGTLLGRFADSELHGFAYNGEAVVTTTRPCSESFLETWTPGSRTPPDPTGACPAPLI